MSKERRAYPRSPVDFPVQVLVPVEAGDPQPLEFPAGASTLSRTSLEIACSAGLIAALLRQCQFPYACRVRFALPGLDGHFDLKGQVVTHRRLSQQQYVLVLLLIHEDADREQALEQALLAARQIGLD